MSALTPKRAVIRRFALAVLVAGCCATACFLPPAIAADMPAADKPAINKPTASPQTGDSEQTREVARARREVRLLDDVYKTAIVLITKHYVSEKTDLAAGEAFKVLFAGMKEKGWHEVRLLDATGEPLNAENKPQEGFERRAIAALLAGKPYYEELATEDGKPYLRAATPLPIVMDKCTMCHGNYRDQKVIGALGYTLPLEAAAAR
ncbi:MAG TPA: DUF3365 domain-containing protein [Pirellulales bacterium]|nr:DUF3365 domain-containing protein [Pirellulales bacterium]